MDTNDETAPQGLIMEGNCLYSKVSPEQNNKKISSFSGIEDCDREDIVLPHISQIFLPWRPEFFFYFTYAGHLGFDVRRSSSVKVGVDLCMKRFCCMKEGVSNKTKDTDLLQAQKNTQKL